MTGTFRSRCIERGFCSERGFVGWAKALLRRTFFDASAVSLPGFRDASPGTGSFDRRRDLTAGHFLDPALAAASVVDQNDRAGRHHAVERLLLDHRRIAWTGGGCELRTANATGEQANTKRERSR